MHEPETPERELPARLPADPLDERMLDLLVDGELSPAETRELLSRCEERPEAWRRCALAFLEAQAWRRGLGGLRSEPAATAPAVPTAAPVAAPRPAGWAAPHRMRNWLAMAASIACAFLLGLEARDFWRQPAGPQPVAVAPGPPVETPVDPTAPAPQLVGRNTLAGGLTLQGAGLGREAIQVPVYSGPDVDEAWLRSLPAQVPPELQELLQRMGRRVEVRREIVPLDLGDGQQVIVPVDELEIRIEPRAYQ